MATHREKDKNKPPPKKAILGWNNEKYYHVLQEVNKIPRNI